jgi:hypothetical protein
MFECSVTRFHERVSTSFRQVAVLLGNEGEGGGILVAAEVAVVAFHAGEEDGNSILLVSATKNRTFLRGASRAYNGASFKSGMRRKSRSLLVPMA